MTMLMQFPVHSVTQLLFWSVCWMDYTKVVECGRDRVYFVAAVETLWDYAPSNSNRINGLALQSDSHAKVFTSEGENRIGKIYQKVIYRPYKNIRFTEPEDHGVQLGIMGPVIKGEVGDKIIVYFKNMASRNYSMHPHGVFYLKSSEGALYKDKTFGDNKGDDHVPPQGLRKYTWIVKPEFSPEEGDPNCLTWLYHSHVNPVKDINTGLIGTLLTCKPGFLNQYGKRTDVKKEFFLLYLVFDENQSWLLDENLRRKKLNATRINKEDAGFQESNLMHSINGYMYGNLPGIEMCAGDSISWHMSGLGNEVDIHTVYFQGNTIIADHHRTDVQLLFPASSATVSMIARSTGKWMLSCQVADHYSAGMVAFYDVKPCQTDKIDNELLNGRQRSFFIAADEVEWNYGPTGLNLFDGGSLTESGSESAIFFERSHNRVGGTYIKALYREYTDASFKTRKIRKSEEDYLGMLGPVIRAEVGDEIHVTFKNNASFPFSMQPHGVVYDKANEGGWYQDGANQKADGKVLPGNTYVYIWTVPKSVAPSSSDPACISYFYSSSYHNVEDKYSGLIGPLVICKKGELDQNGVPYENRQEKFILFSIIDENKSNYMDKNMARFCKTANCSNVDKEDEDFVESNKMHCINGYKYGNMPNLTICQGEDVLWHVIGMGSETDMHTVYFHGNAIDDMGNHKDTIAVFPGTFSTFSMKADNPGKWPLVCGNNDHLLEGMKNFYTVKECNKYEQPEGGKKRTIYIGIVEREWDYAPTNRSAISGHLLDEPGSESRHFVHRGPNTIGKVYKKALFRSFTDASFSVEKPRGEREEHLGVLGPEIIAEESDEIKVIVKNFGSRDYSVHPHGLFYKKEDEGSKYLNRGSENSPAVQPGKIRTYTWLVPKRASPGQRDSQCVTWAYYSSIDPVKDTNSGLVGPLIVCRKGTLGSDGRRKDIDRAFTLFFTVLDENLSWYLDQNIQTYIGKNAKLSKSNGDFQESNKMHAINGYIYGNSQHFIMKENETINWYLIGLGGEPDIHTVHFHGHTFVQRTNSKHRKDVYDLFPGIFATLEMNATNQGTWLLHCHVHDHINGGMETTYTIRGEGDSSQENSSSDFGHVGSSKVVYLLQIFMLTFVCNFT